MSTNGKGDSQRPCNKEKFDSEFDRIFGKKEQSEESISHLVFVSTPDGEVAVEREGHPIILESKSTPVREFTEEDREKIRQRIIMAGRRIGKQGTQPYIPLTITDFWTGATRIVLPEGMSSDDFDMDGQLQRVKRILEDSHDGS